MILRDMNITKSLKYTTIIILHSPIKLQKVHTIPELISAAEETGHDIICIQEHRFIHGEPIIEDQSYGNWKFVSISVWQISLNAATGRVGF